MTTNDLSRLLKLARWACLVSLSLALTFADAIPVKQRQGAMHGFLVLKSAEDKVIATGDQINEISGDSVRSRLTFHFRDGSLDDELTTFTQGKIFQLVSDHHVQKGPSFPELLDLAVDMKTKKVTWHEKSKNKEEVKSESMDLPPDLANGLTSMIIENFPKDASEMKVSYLAGGSKPRVVKLSVKPDGKDQYRLVTGNREANRFNVHVEIGGVAGAIAPIVGKQPDDIKVWIAQGPVPAFLRMEGALYVKGPTWTMELAVPLWPGRVK